MSRTYRRTTGDQTTTSIDQNELNPYFHRSPWKYQSTRVPEERTIWNYIPSNDGFTGRHVIVKELVWVHKFIGYVWEDNPLDHYEMLEKQVDAINWKLKWNRDRRLDYSHKTLKEHSKSLRRTDAKRELSRIAKLNNFEEIDYLDSKRNSDRWFFD